MERAPILPSAATLAPPYTRHYFINGTIFGKNGTEHKMCILISLQGLFETFLILRKIKRDIAINVKTSSRKALVILFEF